MESSRELRIASVGAIKNCQADMWRLATAVNYMKDLGCQVQNDIINLCYGRDFLEEDLCYDAVIVCYIYRYHRSHWMGFSDEDRQRCRTSVFHTPENWVVRLKATGASYIFVYGADDELNGNDLRALVPDYQILSDKAGFDRLTIFKNANIIHSAAEP